MQQLSLDVLCHCQWMNIEHLPCIEKLLFKLMLMLLLCWQHVRWCCCWLFITALFISLCWLLITHVLYSAWFVLQPVSAQCTLLIDVRHSFTLWLSWKRILDKFIVFSENLPELWIKILKDCVVVDLFCSGLFSACILYNSDTTCFISLYHHCYAVV